MNVFFELHVEKGSCEFLQTEEHKLENWNVSSECVDVHLANINPAAKYIWLDTTHCLQLGLVPPLRSPPARPSVAHFIQF